MINETKPDFEDTPVSSLRPSWGYRPAYPTENPVVSVVTPFFNTGSVFHETAASLLNQSLQAFEWLIINDGTTDVESIAVLDTYRRLDPRIRVIDQPNAGPSSARNTGFENAKCKYVFQLDSDDLIEPTTLEKCVWFMESNPEFSFVKGYSVGFGAQQYLWRRGFHTPIDLRVENPVTTNCLVRKSAHSDIGGYDTSIRHGMEDWDFWLRALQRGHFGGVIPEFLDWYRRRPSHGDKWSNWNEEGTRKFLIEARSKYPQVWDGVLTPRQPRPRVAFEDIPTEAPFANPLVHVGKKHVLVITAWMNIGGADKFLLDVIEQFKRQDIRVTVATTVESPNPWISHFARQTSDIFPLFNFIRASDHARFLDYLVKSRNIDTILVTNSYLGYAFLPFLKARNPDVFIADYVHMEEEHWKRGGYARASINHSALLDVTVVASQHLKDWMIGQGSLKKPIEVCTINIDSTIWDPERFDRLALRKDLGIDDATPVILYAGRLTQQKQPNVFAECMRQLAAKEPFVCLVAGDGPYMDFLRTFVRDHKLGFVRLLGSVENRRIQELLALSDVFFLPSEMEGISLAIYEAMAMKCVPVGARVGGQAELVTPDVGFLIERGKLEIQDYVTVLQRLIADKGLRDDLGQAARQRVQKSFAIETMGNRMADLLCGCDQGAVTRRTIGVDLAIGDLVAQQALENARLESLADQLWALRHQEPNLSLRQAAKAFAYNLIRRLPARFQDPAWAWGKKIWTKLNR